MEEMTNREWRRILRERTQKEYLPHPDTIRAACERIQATWTKHERRRRRVQPLRRVEVTEAHIDLL
jgi:hypothetical protein